MRMTGEELCIRACKYAIGELTRKGSSAFITSVHDDTQQISWADVIEWLNDYKRINEDEEVHQLTPWGCMSVVLEDYGISCDHITGTIGNHLVEDFMDMMVKQGHVCKKEEDV